MLLMCRRTEFCNHWYKYSGVIKMQVILPILWPSSASVVLTIAPSDSCPSYAAAAAPALVSSFMV